MEYIQMTLDDWVQMKQKLRQELIGVKQSFVRIGYALRQIDDQRLYENDGYKSIAEFAKAEYGLEASTTSRFMSINREYSIDGYSEHLRPEYTDLGRSQLEEMLKLPDDDAAVGEAGTDEVEETESGSVADNEPAPGAGEEQKDDSTDGDTDCREDNREPADRAEEQTGEKSLAEQIAPAQKSPQILEKSEPESIEKEENEAQSIEENEPEIENEKPETEVAEVCMTRREYMNTLTVAKLADYIAEEHHSGHLLASDLIFPEKISQWLRGEVDRYGKAQS
jgi:hypothetical protein